MNRTAGLLLSLVLLLPMGIMSQSGPQTVLPRQEEEMMRQVLELEAQAKEAALRNDAAFAERTLADDYIAIGPLGNVLTKNDSVLARRGGKLHYESIEISERVVRVYGDTAIVTARAVVKGNNLGEDFSGPYRFTRVWVKRNGQWQAVSYQATVTQ
jgi:hypothetical protein